MIKFGVAGNSDSFYNQGYKSTIESAKWCAEFGIDVFEYSFGRGIKMRRETAEEIGKAFFENKVDISVHSPYFINFANKESEKIDGSINYVLSCLEILDYMKGDRVVVHPASQGKETREDAFAKTRQNLLLLAEKIEETSHESKKVCLETMGKIGQIGSLDEIIELCKLAPFFYPCIDFGHINAREGGILTSTKVFEDMFLRMLDNMPLYKVNEMHIHFSKIEYGVKGELRHLTFEDNVYGPNPEHLCEALYKLKIKPYIICESRGTQAEDCIFMKNYYNLLKLNQQ